VIQSSNRVVEGKLGLVAVGLGLMAHDKIGDEEFAALELYIH